MLFLMWSQEKSTLEFQKVEPYKVLLLIPIL